jgi:hypothetical protein
MSTVTRRLSVDVIETSIGGDVSARDIEHMCEQFRMLGRARAWLIDATGAYNYAPLAINAMVRELGRLQREYGLDLLVAVITSRAIRMGASFVKVAVSLTMEFVATRAEAVHALRKAGLIVS